MPTDETAYDRRSLIELIHDMAAGKPLREPALSAKHTPGPWRVGGHPGDNSGTNWRTVLSDSVRPYGDGAYVCQAREADAKLIAAMPRMLAALNGLLQHCTARYPTDAAAAIAEAREVIAIATA